MPVNENYFPARLVIISSQYDRITAGGKFFGIEACLFEALQEPIRTRFNLGLKLGIGRYGRKPKKLDQIIKRIIPGHEVQNTEVGVMSQELGGEIWIAGGSATSHHLEREIPLCHSVK